MTKRTESFLNQGKLVRHKLFAHAKMNGHHFTTEKSKMNQIGRIIYQQRISRKWSQEELCRGICAVSYLSKIETGKAEPSEDITAKLMERLGIKVDEEAEEKARILSEEAYDLLFSAMNQEFKDLMNSENTALYDATACGIDLSLLRQLAADHPEPLPSTFEGMMDQRQKALQRIIQGNCEEALNLFPNAWMYLMSGIDEYEKGNIRDAQMSLSKSYETAAEEGSVRVMMSTALYLMRCAMRVHDYEQVKKYAASAERIASAFKDRKTVFLIQYNRAYAAAEAADYESAYAFLRTLEKPNAVSLLLKAVCCEKTGNPEEGKSALNEAQKLIHSQSENTLSMMMKVMRMRLDNLTESVEYGEVLSELMRLIQNDPVSGFDSLYLSWLLEWYQNTRQYKKAFALLSENPWLAKNEKKN